MLERVLEEMVSVMAKPEVQTTGLHGIWVSGLMIILGKLILNAPTWYIQIIEARSKLLDLKIKKEKYNSSKSKKR